MPLDRAHVTAASRVMLPTYPAFFGILGAGLVFTPTGRLTATPVFRYVDDHLLDIHLWGVGFLLLAAAFAAALLTHRRRVYQLALGCAIGWMSLWTVLAAASAAETGSFTAWAWPAFVGVACWASLVSLETKET